jgi:hypothetical protein
MSSISYSTAVPYDSSNNSLFMLKPLNTNSKDDFQFNKTNTTSNKNDEEDLIDIFALEDLDIPEGLKCNE